MEPGGEGRVVLGSPALGPVGTGREPGGEGQVVLGIPARGPVGTGMQRFQDVSISRCLCCCGACPIKSNFYDLMNCSPPGSSVHGILQARILAWVAISSSRGSSRPRDRTWVCCVSCIGRRVLYHQNRSWEAPIVYIHTPLSLGSNGLLFANSLFEATLWNLITANNENECVLVNYMKEPN